MIHLSMTAASNSSTFTDEKTPRLLIVVRLSLCWLDMDGSIESAYSDGVHCLRARSTL
jgi:hypothetical protein